MWSPAPLPRTFEAALRDLADQRASVRASAASDLANFSDEPLRSRAAQRLAQALDDTAAEVRASAAQSLGELGDSPSVPALARRVADADPLVRQLAIEALGAIGGDEALTHLRSVLSDARPEVRFQAIMAYAKIAPEGDADRALLAAMSDPDGSIVYIALRVAEELLEQRGDQAPPLLVARARVLCREGTPEQRVAAALLLAKCGDEGCRPVLLDVIEGRLVTREAEDEAAAVEAAGEAGLSEAMGALEARAYGAGRLLRETWSFHAKISLARLGHARATADLMADLSSWTLANRNLAVLALGKARVVAASALLRELRGRPDRADPDLIDEALSRIEARKSQ